MKIKTLAIGASLIAICLITAIILYFTHFHLATLFSWVAGASGIGFFIFSFCYDTKAIKKFHQKHS